MKEFIAKIKHIFHEKLIISLNISCSKCGSNNNKILEKEEIIEILKIIGLVDNKKWIFIILNAQGL